MRYRGPEAGHRERRLRSEDEERMARKIAMAMEKEQKSHSSPMEKKSQGPRAEPSKPRADPSANRVPPKKKHKLAIVKPPKSGRQEETQTRRG